MCGIVYVKRKDKKPAYKSVLKRYRSQKNRGQQGFGYVAIKDGVVMNYKRSETENGIIESLIKEDADEILMHHRMPTSTPNIEESAHPLLVEDDSFKHKYFVAHNGVISNQHTLKRAHEHLGIVYTTEISKAFISNLSGKTYKIQETIFNDSESLAVETALAMEGQKHSIDTEGSAAVVGIQTEGRKVISRFFYRNLGNPLRYHEDNIMVTLTSLGAGVIVEPDLVLKLNDTHGFRPYNNVLKPPKSYKNAYDSEFYRKHRYDRASDTYILIDEPKTKNNLTLPTPPVGFHRHGRSNLGGSNSEAQYIGEIMRQTMQDDKRTADEIVEDIEKLSKALKDDVPVTSFMGEGKLWAEFDKTISAQETLEREVGKIEAEIEEDIYSESGGYADILSERLEARQVQLAATQRYMEELEKEIDKRMARTPSLLNAS